MDFRSVVVASWCCAFSLWITLTVGVYYQTVICVAASFTGFMGAVIVDPK